MSRVVPGGTRAGLLCRSGPWCGPPPFLGLQVRSRLPRTQVAHWLSPETHSTLSDHRTLSSSFPSSRGVRTAFPQVGPHSPCPCQCIALFLKKIPLPVLARETGISGQPPTLSPGAWLPTCDCGRAHVVPSGGCRHSIGPAGGPRGLVRAPAASR